MNNKDELYHYGVKGMKWKGHVYATKEDLKNAKKTYRKDVKQMTRSLKLDYLEPSDYSTVHKDKTTSEMLKRKGMTKEYIRDVTNSASLRIAKKNLTSVSVLSAAVIGSYVLSNYLKERNRTGATIFHQTGGEKFL